MFTAISGEGTARVTQATSKQSILTMEKGLQQLARAAGARRRMEELAQLFLRWEKCTEGDGGKKCKTKESRRKDKIVAEWSICKDEQKMRKKEHNDGDVKRGKRIADTEAGGWRKKKGKS
jgi:hypothetical protein